jgi:hypothetical protein
MSEAYKQPDSAVETAKSVGTDETDVRNSVENQAEYAPIVKDPYAGTAGEYGEGSEYSVDFSEVRVTPEGATRVESIAVQAILIGFALVYIPLLSIAAVAMMVIRVGVPLAAHCRCLWNGRRNRNTPK